MPPSAPEPIEVGTEGEVFKPTARFWLAFSPLTVLVVMVALDGTCLSVALPVSPLGRELLLHLKGSLTSMPPDHFPKPRHDCN